PRKELTALAAGLPTICTSPLEASLAKVNFPRWPPYNQRRRCPPTPTPTASAHAFWHCSAHCTQNCIGFIAAPAKASALGQVPAGTLGRDFSFDSIADGAVIGFGDLICSSQTSIMSSIIWIC